MCVCDLIHVRRASPSSTPRHSIDYSDKLCCRNVNLVATNDADRLLTLQAALKCSDLGHLAAPLPIHLKWVSGLEDEFFQQVGNGLLHAFHAC